MTILETCQYGCADDHLSCRQTPNVCDPAACERTEAVRGPICGLLDADNWWAVFETNRRYTCQPGRFGNSWCVANVTYDRMASCPNGCAPDGATCATSPPSVQEVRGTAYAAVSPDSYKECPGCTLRFAGTGETFEATTGGDGRFRIPDVPAGTYRIERQCGDTWLHGHAPWDVALNTAAVTVPLTAQVDVLLPKCP